MNIGKQLKAVPVLLAAGALYALFASVPDPAFAQQAPAGKDAGQQQTQPQKPEDPWTPAPDAPGPEQQKRREYETQC